MDNDINDNSTRYDRYASDDVRQNTENVESTVSPEQAENIESTANVEAQEPAEAPKPAEAAETAAESRTDPGQVSWNGSSYSGRPYQDNMYSSYAQPFAEQRIYEHREQPYQGQPYPGYGPYPYGAFNGSPVMKQPKKEMPRALRTVLTAVIFGVVASLTFAGGSLLLNKCLPLNGRTHSASNKTIEAPENDSYRIASTKLADSVDMTATDVSSVVETAMPSIVQINCTFTVQNWFGTYESQGAGSGIIIKRTDKELLIATNNHVVDSANSINITFIDGSTAPAIIKGTDSTADLAVVAVDISKLDEETGSSIAVAKLGDSGAVKVGQMVVAIGNAMGYGQSTTVGYVSAKDREVTVDNKVMVLIQTDAAINPGNSGGALLNLKGEVIGINSVKYANEEVEGMGFAIPISRAQSILNELASRETLKEEEKGYLGVYLQEVTDDIAAKYDWPVGIYVSQLMEGLAAEKAGIQVGDIIVGVNGSTVKTATELKAAITAHRVGEEITVSLKRLENGKFIDKDIKVELGMNPEYATETKE